MSEAIYWMRDNGLTSAQKIVDYYPFDTLTREQAAKMFVQFMKSGNFDAISGINNDCSFKDSKIIDPNLLTSVQEACSLGIMQGNGGVFNPQNALKKSEFITTLIRISEGKKLDETPIPRWKNYFQKAMDL